MTCQTKGSFETRVLTDGTRAFHLRFQVERQAPVRRRCTSARPAVVAAVGAGRRSQQGRARRPHGAGAGRTLATATAAASCGQRDRRGRCRPSAITRLCGSTPRSRECWVTARSPRTRSTTTALGCVTSPTSLPTRWTRSTQVSASSSRPTSWRRSRQVREAIAAGTRLHERSGRARRPLGPATVRKVLDALGSILEEAVEDGLLEHNPARGRRMRVRVPKPKRTCLEIDELAYLLDAACRSGRPACRRLS